MPKLEVLEKESEVKDAVGYKLNTIYFYLTQGCNLRCCHCWIAPPYVAAENTTPCISVDLFQKIIDQAKPLGLASVKLTGGEPLIHPEITKILSVIQKEELGLVIETNGVKCTPEVCAEIKKSKNPFVSVSLDGVDAETNDVIRGVAGAYDAAVQGIKNLVAVGIRPQIIMSIMAHNRDQIELMLNLAKSLNVSSVKFNVVQPTSRGEKMHDAGKTISVSDLIALGDWVDTVLAPQYDFKIFFHRPVAFKPLSKLFGGNGISKCNILGIIGVLATGAYALCGIGESVPELKFGDARTDSLKEIWENNAILNDIRTGMPDKMEGICGACMLKHFCLGSCVAQNYYSTKNLWSGFWFCEQADQLKLFPAARKRV